MTKRIAMHNISDSECLKGYYLCLKLGQFITAEEGVEEAVRHDVLYICLSLKFCFLSVTVKNNMDKNHSHTAYIIKTDAEQQQSDSNLPCVCALCLSVT